MLLMIDNYDSFTYNLVAYFTRLQINCHVIRNDAADLTQIKTLAPSAIAISPGPGNPQQTGICLKVIAHFANKLPILGICLGHQTLAAYFGARIINAAQVMHGKVSSVYHQHQGLFHNLTNPMQATRYHSLVVDEKSLPPELLVDARTEDNTVMAIRHAQLPLYGIQFHPEAILTEQGLALLDNFVKGWSSEKN